MVISRRWLVLIAVVIFCGSCFFAVHSYTVQHQPQATVKSPETKVANRGAGTTSLPDTVNPSKPKKVASIVSRAITEKWPNLQIRALISMTRSPELIAELWSRQPLDAQDLCILTLHSTTPDDKIKAAKLWAELEPNNAEPRYTILVNEWLHSSDKSSLLPQILEIINSSKINSYYSERSIAYEMVAKSQSLAPIDGISPLDASDTNTKAFNLLNLVVKNASELAGSDIASRENLAAICAGLAGQIVTKKDLRMQEYQSAVVAELSALNQLDDQTEYGREGYSVADRKKELARISEENMNMKRLCNESISNNPTLAELFKTRSKALGEYEAYRQIYSLITPENTKID